MNDSCFDRASAAVAPVRRLALDDLPNCLQLAADRKWAPLVSKWQLLFEIGDVYGIDDPGGGLAAAVVSTRYGSRVASIAMMLVATRHARRGLGERLLSQALLRSPAESTILYATTQGRLLYDKLGFRAAGEAVTYVGTLPSAGTHTAISRRAVATDLPAIVDLDAQAFGVPRTVLLQKLLSYCDQIRIIPSSTGIAAYAGSWSQENTCTVGPLIAKDTDTALALISDLAASSPHPLRLDLDGERHPELVAWAIERGMRVNMSSAFMVLGNPLPGDRGRLFCPAALALG